MVRTVGELIEELKRFPADMKEVDYSWESIEKVEIRTWTHNNYPYDKPDKEMVCLL